MSENRRSRRALPAAAAAIALLALGSLVVASASSLGGVRADDLGGAAGDAQRLDALTLDWTPTWEGGAWYLAELTLTADGLRADDQVSVTLAGADGCEVTASAPGTSLALDSAALEQACGSLPALAGLDGVAVAVTGADDITTVSDLGPLTGSVAGFAGDAVRTVDGVSGTVATGRIATVVLDGVAPAALDAVSAAVVVSSGGSVIGEAELTRAELQPDAARSRLTLDLAEHAWALTGTADVQVALSTSQHLTPGVSDVAGVVLASGTITGAGNNGNGNNGNGNNGNGNNGNNGNGNGGTATPGNALDPVAVSNGIAYRYTTPWTGAQTNLLTFCHSFTVTNTTAAALTDWTVTFDTDLAPMWGLDPTAGTVSLSNIETRGYDAASGFWTVGGANAWARQIEAGGARTVQLCATSVPTPAADPELYDVAVTVVASNDWHVTFRVDVTSDSPFYVPWQTEVDLAELVCPVSLQGRAVTFEQSTATPVVGSSTTYLIQGTAGNTQLVSASHSRSFTFASYSPGPGWQLGCG